MPSYEIFLIRNCYDCSISVYFLFISKDLPEFPDCLKVDFAIELSMIFANSLMPFFINADLIKTLSSNTDCWLICGSSCKKIIRDYSGNPELIENQLREKKITDTKIVLVT